MHYYRMLIVNEEVLKGRMRMEKGDVKKASSLMMCAVFVVFLLFFAVGYFFFIPSVIYIPIIEQEQRHTLPELSLQSITDGSFESGLEVYMCENITQRVELIALNYTVNKLLGKTSQKGIHITHDGYFIRDSHFTRDDAERYAEEVSNFADDCGVQVDLLIVPEAGIMLRDKLDTDIQCRTFEEADMNVGYLSELVSDKVNVFYAKEPIQKVIDSGTQAFYRTDHHWTTECAKSVFEWYAEKTSLTLPDIEYEIHSVPGFYGHIYSLLPMFFIESDELHYYINPKGKYQVNCEGSSYTDSMIHYDQAAHNDKYRIFFGGDQKRIEITSNAPKGNIMVIHDSFGRSFLTFLADSCSDICSIDLRQKNADDKNAAQQCREFGADRVLIILYTESINDKRMGSF